MRTNDASRMLRILANQKRLLILYVLARHGEVSVSILAAEIDLGMSALSQHLAKLRGDGLVEARKEGHQVFYRVGSQSVARILDALMDLDLMPRSTNEMTKGKQAHGDSQYHGR